jgi:hypothetical protein
MTLRVFFRSGAPSAACHMERRHADMTIQGRGSRKRTTKQIWHATR